MGSKLSSKTVSTVGPTAHSTAEIHGKPETPPHQNNHSATPATKRRRDEDQVFGGTLEEQPTQRVKRDPRDEAAILEATAEERHRMYKALYHHIHREIPGFEDYPEQDPSMIKRMENFLKSLEQKLAPDDASKAQLHKDILNGTFEIPVKEEKEPRKELCPDEWDDWDDYPGHEQDSTAGKSSPYVKKPPTAEEIEFERIHFPNLHKQFDKTKGCFVDNRTGIPLTYDELPSWFGER